MDLSTLSFIDFGGGAAGCYLAPNGGVSQVTFLLHDDDGDPLGDAVPGVAFYNRTTEPHGWYYGRIDHAKVFGGGLERGDVPVPPEVEIRIGDITGVVTNGMGFAPISGLALAESPVGGRGVYVSYLNANDDLPYAFPIEEILAVSLGVTDDDAEVV